MNTENVSVVIVESQPLMRSALSKAISADGMTVLAEIANSEDAVRIASWLNPNVILFSINHPERFDMQRISVLRQELAYTWIIALVTGEVYGQHQAALDHGAHLVLTKSATRSEILLAIKEVSLKEAYSAVV